MIDLMCGRKVKFSDMFGDKSFDSEEVNGITFESGYDDNEIHTVICYKKSLNLSKSKGGL